MKKHRELRRQRPDRREEEHLFSKGYRRVAGIDEAGRGALAGPVVAACVILQPNASFSWLGHVHDSKLIRAKNREDLFAMMLGSGVEIGIGVIPPGVIDSVNILNATRQAMKMALEDLNEPPDYVLTDAVYLPGLRTGQRNIIKGDRTCLCIACASIAAKVTRDRIMLDLHSEYPRYSFNKHKGYGTGEHMQSLLVHGACEIHRRSFRPVRELLRLL